MSSASASSLPPSEFDALARLLALPNAALRRSCSRWLAAARRCLPLAEAAEIAASILEALLRHAGDCCRDARKRAQEEAKSYEPSANCGGAGVPPPHRGRFIAALDFVARGMRGSTTGPALRRRKGKRAQGGDGDENAGAAAFAPFSPTRLGMRKMRRHRRDAAKAAGLKAGARAWAGEEADPVLMPTILLLAHHPLLCGVGSDASVGLGAATTTRGAQSDAAVVWRALRLAQALGINGETGDGEGDGEGNKGANGDDGDNDDDGDDDEDHALAALSGLSLGMGASLSMAVEMKAQATVEALLSSLFSTDSLERSAAHNALSTLGKMAAEHDAAGGGGDSVRDGTGGAIASLTLEQLLPLLLRRLTSSACSAKAALDASDQRKRDALEALDRRMRKAEENEIADSKRKMGGGRVSCFVCLCSLVRIKLSHFCLFCSLAHTETRLWGRRGRGKGSSRGASQGEGDRAPQGHGGHPQRTSRRRCRA